MDFLVESRSSKKKKFIEAILPSMVTQLGLSSSRKSLLVRLEKDCQGMGYTVPVDIVDSYVVIIQPKMSLKDIGLTLAHEMVHVRQLAKGILKMQNGVNFWQGKKYSKRTKYLDQPWEKDAFSRQEIVFRKAVE